MPSFIEYLKTQIGNKVDPSPHLTSSWLAGTLMAVNETELTIAYTIRPEMTNPMRILHGGIGATMLDETIGTLVFATSGGTFVATINLALDYLSAGKLGETVFATGYIIRRGRQIVHVEGKLSNEQGKILVKCAGNMLITERKIGE